MPDEMNKNLRKIGELLEVQKSQTERLLKVVHNRQAELLKQADECGRHVREAQEAIDVGDVAGIAAREKWARAQHDKAHTLRADAAALNPEIARLTGLLQAHFKKRSGFDELENAFARIKARREEENADQDLLTIVQLAGPGNTNP